MIDRLRGRIERAGDRPAPAPGARRKPDPLAPILWLAYAVIVFAFLFYYVPALVGPAYGQPPLWQAAVAPAVFGALQLRRRFALARKLDASLRGRLLSLAAAAFLAALPWALIWAWSREELTQISRSAETLTTVPGIVAGVVVPAGMAFVAASLHPRLMTALAAALTAPLVFGLAALILPEPTTYPAVNAGFKALALAGGGAGAAVLLAAGVLLRPRVPAHVVWPAAVMFALTAFVYQDLFLYRWD